jgi:predicted metal-dependent hydrolase
MILPENYTLLFKKVKQVRIRVDHDQRVRIVVPTGFPEQRIHEILETKAAWIQRNLERFKKLKPFIPMEAGQLWYRGEIYQIVPDLTRGAKVEVDEKNKRVHSSPRLLRESAQREWYRSEAIAFLPARVHAFVSSHGFPCRRIFIRGQKTRWGSCSKLRNISLNWRLMKAPLHVIEYVILHELIHLEHMNHSRRFWSRVEELCPGYREAILWLKTNGAWL